MTFPDESKKTINDLEDMKIVSPAGSELPLSDLADFTEQMEQLL